VLRDVRRERVIRVRRAEERLHGEQHRADLEGRRPLVWRSSPAVSTGTKKRRSGRGGGRTFQDIETDAAEFVWRRTRAGVSSGSGGSDGGLTDVGVVYLGEKTHFRRRHRVLFW
jgi:hypothetical protein